jgi:hypothetical protein
MSKRKPIRRALVAPEIRGNYPAAKSFQRPLRERKRQPIPPQAREVTLAKRNARKGRTP